MRKSPKFKRSDKLSAPASAVRIATPLLVARYRARRLACDFIVDIGAGIGAQTRAFAETCKKVIAIELDKERARVLRANVADLSNVSVIEGDALSPDIRKEIAGANAYFCDTARPLEEEKRTMDSVRPSPADLQKYFSPLAIELPPQLAPVDIPLDAEKEYISVRGRLNRLTVYFPPLGTPGVRCVALPSESVMQGVGAEDVPSARALRASFLYEVDTAVVKAGLVPQLLVSMPGAFVLLNAKYVLLASPRLHATPFARAYEVYKWVANDPLAIRGVLKEGGYGRVAIHARLAADKYWNVREGLEKGLTGKYEAHLFINGNQAAIARARQ